MIVRPEIYFREVRRVNTTVYFGFEYTGLSKLHQWCHVLVQGNREDALVPGIRHNMEMAPLWREDGWILACAGIIQAGCHQHCGRRKLVDAAWFDELTMSG